jgi:multidrug efflux pump subunit AcrA (membrane-fusion protein)
LSPRAAPWTRTSAARFTILDADDSGACGMTATASLDRAGDEQVAKLPLSSVLNRGKGPAVYVVSDAGDLTLRPVTVAAFTADAALVSAGVHDGDRIVTLGVQKLEAGVRVRAVELP